MKRTYKHEYNGWKNYQTWNVALWLDNDEPTYRMMQEYLKEIALKPNAKPRYIRLVYRLGLDTSKTGDGVSYIQTRLSYKQLNAMLQEQVDDIRRSSK